MLFVEDGGGRLARAAGLREALQSRGAQVITTCLKFCAFDTRLPSGIHIPGFDGELPDGAFVRSVFKRQPGTDHIAPRHLHALRESGVRVWNDARVIERCVDKSTATFFLPEGRAPRPRKRAPPKASKQPANSRPIRRAAPSSSSRSSAARATASVASKQPINCPNRLKSVTFTTYSAICAAIVTHSSKTGASRVPRPRARRHGPRRQDLDHQRPSGRQTAPDRNQFRNDAFGPRSRPSHRCRLCRRRPHPRRYRKLMVLEINSNPAWKGLQSVTDVNIAWTLAEDFLAALPEKARA